MAKRPKLVEKYPTRSLVVEVIGLADAGKSSLVERLMKRFERVGVFSEFLSQDRETHSLVASMRGSLQLLKRRGRFRNSEDHLAAQLVSAVFLGIFKAHELMAQTAVREIVWFEQGPYFTGIVEELLAKTPREVLNHHFQGVNDPDCVLFVDVNPDQIRQREEALTIGSRTGPLTRDWDKMWEIYRVMSAMARRKKWLVVKGGPEKTSDNMTDAAFRKVRTAYQAHLQKAKPTQEFRLE